MGAVEYSHIKKILDDWILYDPYTLLKNIKDKSGVKKFIHSFMTNIRKLHQKQLINKTVLVTGFNCYIGSILLSYAQQNINPNEEMLIYFSCFYMIIDHFIDDPNIHPSHKKKYINLLQKNLYNPKDYKRQDFVGFITQCYIKILKYKPEAKHYLIIAFLAEIYSHIEQSNGYNNLYSYYTHTLFLSEFKGGTTVQAIQSLLDLPVTENEYKLGACIQLVDDIIDVEDDLKSNILTPAYIQYSHLKNLDSIIIYTLKKIVNLPDKYNIFKAILINILVSHISHTTYISDKFKTFLAPWTSKINPISKECIMDIIYHHLHNC